MAHRSNDSRSRSRSRGGRNRSNSSRRRRPRLFEGEPNGVQPGDDIGNRGTSKQNKVPDDVGNRKTKDDIVAVPADDCGNRLTQAPTHDLTGLLPSSRKKNTKQKSKRLSRDPHVKIGRYILGGVNPLVSPDPSRARAAQELINAAQRERELFEVDPRHEELTPKERLAKFINLENEARLRFTLTSKPEEKAEEARSFLDTLFSSAGILVGLSTEVLEDPAGPRLLLSLTQPQIGGDQTPVEDLFAVGSVSWDSISHLLTKVVNRLPDDRIRLTLLPSNTRHEFLQYFSEYAPQEQERIAVKAKERERRAHKKQNRLDHANISKTYNPQSANEETESLATPESSTVKHSQITHSAVKTDKILTDEPSDSNSSDANALTSTIAVTATAEHTINDSFQKAATKKTAIKKTATKKTATKKTATKKTATKKTATKKTATKKTATKKTATKKTATKKTATKKTATKKTATKKTATKKTATKKTATKKTATKKTAIKKTATKKTATKKTATKKTATKKAALNKTSEQQTSIKKDDTAVR